MVHSSRTTRFDPSSCPYLLLKHAMILPDSSWFLQVQKMYDIFNINNMKMMHNLAAAGSVPRTPQSLPLPPGMNAPAAWEDELNKGPYSADRSGLGNHREQPSLPLPWDAPKGPKPFGILHDTFTNVKMREKYKVTPHHYTERWTPFNSKSHKVMDRADDGTNTTVQLANIPDGLTADECVDGLDRAGFFASYDYIKFRVSHPLSKTMPMTKLLQLNKLPGKSTWEKGCKSCRRKQFQTNQKI